TPRLSLRVPSAYFTTPMEVPMVYFNIGCLRFPRRMALARLSLALGLPFCLGVAQAQEEAKRDDPYLTREVIVSATKREKDLSKIGSSVTVITGKEIERRQTTRDVLELLRDVPAFSVVQSGGRGGVANVFVRGGEQDYNLVMIDGIQMNRLGGDYDFSTLVTDNIERIEVLRGPQSSLYGSDAISSVINIISKKGEGPPKATVQAMAGSYSTFEEMVSLSGGGEGFGYSGALSHYDTNGHLDINNDAHNTSFRGRLDLTPYRRLALGFTMGYNDLEYNFPTDSFGQMGTIVIDPNQAKEIEETIMGVEAVVSATENWKHHLKLSSSSFNRQDYDDFDPIPTDTGNSQTTTDEDRKSADYRQVFEAEPVDGTLSITTVGVEFEDQEFEQTIGGLSTANVQTTTMNNKSRRIWGYYVQQEFDVDERFFLTMGVRYDRSSAFRDSVIPQASVAYLFPTDTKIRGAVGKGVREPSFRESFGSATVIPNPNLKPERSFSWETGVDQSLIDGRILLTVTYFENEFRDMIASNLVIGSFAENQNIQKARTRGFEYGAKVKVTDTFGFGGTYTALETCVLGDGGVSSTNFVVGEALNRRPRDSGSYYAEYDDKTFQACLSGTSVGNRIDRDFGADAAGLRVRARKYTKLDLNTSYKIWEDEAAKRDARLKLQIQNLLDKDIEEAFYLQAPGINFMFGGQVNF
ncbi:MAG: TonB-dependent receptor plug domain-containing protein, partial [Planctomycetota bacterium]